VVGLKNYIGVGHKGDIGLAKLFLATIGRLKNLSGSRELKKKEIEQCDVSKKIARVGRRAFLDRMGGSPLLTGLKRWRKRIGVVGWGASKVGRGKKKL